MSIATDLADPWIETLHRLNDKMDLQEAYIEELKQQIAELEADAERANDDANYWEDVAAERAAEIASLEERQTYEDAVADAKTVLEEAVGCLRDWETWRWEDSLRDAHRLVDKALGILEAA